jgi:conjugative transfer signal peptidase TraF
MRRSSELSGTRPCERSAVPAARIGPWTAVAAIVCASLFSTLLLPPRLVLLWNASASSRVGLYAVMASSHFRPGDIAVAWPPGPAGRLAAARHYLPARVPLVKRVAAVAGDQVCARRTTIFINGRRAELRRSRDRSRRPMPWWSGCKVLQQGELFLLSAGVAEAFDGRYFGVTRSSEIVGKARLLWPR